MYVYIATHVPDPDHVKAWKGQLSREARGDNININNNNDNHHHNSNSNRGPCCRVDNLETDKRNREFNCFIVQVCPFLVML